MEFLTGLIKIRKKHDQQNQNNFHQTNFGNLSFVQDVKKDVNLQVLLIDRCRSILPTWQEWHLLPVNT